MILNAYSVFDRKTLSYGQPFFTHQDGAAVRMLSDAVVDPSTLLSKHPADFVLFKIGRYDDQLGQLSPIAPIEHVIDVVSLVSTGNLITGEQPGQHPPASILKAIKA